MNTKLINSILAGLRKEVGLLRPGPRGPKVLPHQMRYSDELGSRSTRDGDTGNEDDSSVAGFSNLTNMPCSVLP